MEIPIKPLKNEDGTFTVRFPDDMIVNDELVATHLQMIITEFAIRFYAGGQISYEKLPRHPKNNK